MTKIRKIADSIIIESNSYSRLATILRGVVPNVNTIGFITAENPNGKQQTMNFNKEANLNLEKELRLMNLGFHKIKDNYGMIEHSYAIPNIRKNEILELGKKYEQETVIFGEKDTELKNDARYTGLKFDLIYTDYRFGKVESTRSIFMNDNQMDNFYSEIHGRKFYIPFFYDSTEKLNWKGTSGIIESLTISDDLINDLNETVVKIFEGDRSPKSIWIHRGHIKNIINKLDKN
jgi:hypothetical protein